MTSTLPAVESINRSLSEICSADESCYSWENPRRFSGYAKRLQLVLNQLLRFLSPDNLPPSVQTSLKGIAGDLTEVVEALSVYRNKSKIFVLINCQSLRASLQQRTIAIGGWMALLESSLHDIPDLRKKVADLSKDMKQIQFRVTDNEERVYCTLQKEGQGRINSKAVQTAIIMDLARALGIDSNNHSELLEQVKLLKNDLSHSSSVSERRILTSLERIMANWSTEPDILIQNLVLDWDDDVHISPFKTFLCPLTKEVMKDPVVLESSQTYERIAIKYWFDRCEEDGRDPTCPVTGQVLNSLELKPNIGLAGAIEEWVNRNIDIQIKSAAQCLNEEDPPPVDGMERVLDNIYKISEEHPSSRYRVRSAGIVLLIVKLLRNSSKKIGSHLRSKALMALLSMAKDEESKNIMLEEGITRLAIHSLTGSLEKEREFAVKLILEFSSDETYCKKIASEKGALVLLSSLAGNLEYPAVSNLAEEVLKMMERVEDNIQHLAAAGRFEPLLSRLCEGSDDIKIKMASLVGRMTLTNNSKEQIARQSARVLVELLYKPEGRAPSLQALYNLSSLDDNATILVDSAVFPALTDILFENQDASRGWELKELAASTIANIVSNPGHWELASADKGRHSMQSESIVFSLLGLLFRASPQCQVSILQILYGIASSPQASESVTTHIKSGDGFKIIIPFLEHPEVEHRINAFRLTRVLSERFGDDLANELKTSNKLSFFKDKLLDNQSTDAERSDAACILANLTLSEDEVKSVQGAGFVRWTVTTLKDKCRASSGRTSRSASSMVEGLLGLLLHFTRSTDPQTVSVVNENQLMIVFREALVLTSKPRVKQLAVLGLKNLSETGRTLIAGSDSELQPPHGFCSSLVFMCGRGPPAPPTCPVHNAPCEENSQFCLLKSNSIKPLVDLLSDEDTNVQIVALEALSTLVIDTNNDFKRAVDKLEQLGVVDAAITLFSNARPGELQERAIWMLERMLRAESVTNKHSLNQSLVRALVEALKHGNAATKRLSQEALTNLKQISGISGKTSSQTQGRR
ncbi:U-box domain-containing protein 44-like isoform X3 [Cornus florida]|uniref:U-box domain-containing protein 44-like isoform X1 n=1 Tax=Cornus florida TaxID=4283 RepID=UPI0028A0B731|nr:U-box domain-containing protein 44-like isoform X1 [Cornus florida]XP_059660879.1 U-box domain-containing protein 44-like isoform X2 [Cornus florida]XP_059660880.1 U-box domain-containing protein 44-like isoform X3 [Cornus florida]